MAATRLIALHVNKGKTFSQTIKDRIEYVKNEDKTEGEYISCYECEPKLIEEQFNLSKHEYEKTTSRFYKNDIIAYQIRQSFKPGEITPEEANAVGYETAMRFLKGKNAFIVATHTDKEHIHNHIIFNAIDLIGKHKYRDFLRSGKALQKVSDLICIEHGLSVIKPRSLNEQSKEELYITPSFRDNIRLAIDNVLEKEPASLENFLEMLKQNGYEVKQGKYISVRGEGQKTFIRLRSLGNGYRDDDVLKRIAGEVSVTPNVIKRKRKEKKVDLLIDINKKLAEGKSGGYERWARLYNVKQMAKTIMFLQEHNIRDMETLVAMADEKSTHYSELLSGIKDCEKRLSEIKDLKENVINYAKTRETYAKYKSSGYSKKFYEDHREEIDIHKATRKSFSELEGKVPKMAALNQESNELWIKKKELYAEYQKAKQDMKEFQIAKNNVESFLCEDEKLVQQKKKENQI